MISSQASIKQLSKGNILMYVLNTFGSFFWKDEINDLAYLSYWVEDCFEEKLCGLLYFTGALLPAHCIHHKATLLVYSQHPGHTANVYRLIEWVSSQC